MSLLKKHQRSSLKLLGTVGEPINPEAWRWYYDVVGNKNCKIVDTWWQTETGGILISPLPGVHLTKPGATKPLFGVKPVIVDQNNKFLRGLLRKSLFRYVMAWANANCIW